MLILLAVVVAATLTGCAALPSSAVPSPAVPVAAAAPPAAPAVPGTGTVSAVGALSGVSASGPGSVAVAPFQEADVVKVKAGQPAQVSVDALAGTTFPGRVAGVAPAGVNISGVTEYYVSVVLTVGDPRLRAGQTARITVSTG